MIPLTANERSKPLMWGGVLLFGLGVAVGLLIQQPTAMKAEAAQGPSPQGAKSVTSFTPDLQNPPSDIGGQRVELVLGAGDRPGPAAKVQLRSFPELSTTLSELIASGSKDRNAYMDVLQALVQTGSPQAIALVVGAMENEEVKFSGRAASFATLLTGVTHPAIQPAAILVLDRNIATGLDSWNHVNGYIQLIASTGGPAGANKLLDLIEEDDSTAVHEAAQAFAKVEGHGQAERALTVVQDARDYPAGLLAKSLAEWKDPQITAKLLTIAEDPARPEHFRAEVLEAIGKNMEAPAVPAFIAPYWSANDSDRYRVMQRVYGVASNRQLSDSFKREQLSDMLRDSIRNGEGEGRQLAMYSVEYNKAFQTPEMLEMLKSERLRETVTERRNDLSRLIASLEEDL